MHDRLHRPLRDLRISLTDHCNFRCGYCMPKSVFAMDHAFLPARSLLSFDEIERMAQAFIACGVQKIRLTGGEPLLRKDVEPLVHRLAQLRTLNGDPIELTLTTNASLLERKARALAEAGLQRVTVSLDALDDAVFRRMNDVDFPVQQVLNGIAAAQAAGMGVKINMVVQRGVNDHQIEAMAQHFRGTGVVLRFIEYMDVGSTNGWQRAEVVAAEEILARVHAAFPIERLPASVHGETAQRWRYLDGAGELGVIASVTQPFCGDCHRARLSPEGKLFTCLFATDGHDLRAALRDDADLISTIRHVWQQRGDRYSQQRAEKVPATRDKRIEMHYIGG